MSVRKLYPLLLCALFIVGCRDFILHAVMNDPPPNIIPPEPVCSLEGEIVSYTSIECYCCPGYEIVFDSQSIFVSDLGDQEVETVVLDKIRNNELPIAISFSYDEPDTQCINHQYLTCIQLK
jgi:hypothetical protein